MAKRGRKDVPGIVSGGSKGGSKPGPKGRGGRPSVASARRHGGDRSTLIIGGVAIVVIIVIIAVGLVLHAKNTAVQGAGYGTSTQSVATVDADGTITVSNGSPDLVLDVYEDALCPICAELEHQYGEQMAKAVDDGELTLRYKMVDFLNASSASGDYSTRAYAALITVAKVDGADKGVFMSFHTAIYDSKNQPKENGTSDLSNADLAKIAGASGASEKAQKEITDGANVQAAQADAQKNLESLRTVAAKVGRSPGTPTVAKDGVPISTQNTDWLTNLLPKSDATSAGDSAPVTSGN